MRGALIVGCVWILGACGEPEPGPPPLPLHPCHSEVERLEVAPPSGEFGDLADQGALWCGSPPQGGAPYSPFRIRVLGPDAFADGLVVEMSAVDADSGEALAYTDLVMGLACANVGDNAGFWVGSEAHMRYAGWSLEDLEGRVADLSVTVTPVEGAGPVIEETWRVDLVLD